jgi:hypothetical protein
LRNALRFGPALPTTRLSRAEPRGLVGQNSRVDKE